MHESGGTRKTLLVGGVAFVVGSLMTLQILGPEVPKPEPRFVDALPEPAVAVPPAAPMPEVTALTADTKAPLAWDAPDETQEATLDVMPATAPVTDPLDGASSVFAAPDLTSRNDSAQFLGLGQDPETEGSARVADQLASADLTPLTIDLPDAASSDVIAGLEAVVAEATKPKTDETLVADQLVTAVNDGVADEEIEALISAAVDDGKIAIPPSVFQVDGQLDTRALLLTLVEKAVDEGNKEAPKAVANIVKVAPLKFSPPALQIEEDLVASTSTTASPSQEKAEPLKPQLPTSYIVRPGDSLAAIAFRFYGSTGAYYKIYVANQDSIANPSKIFVGQRLKIPG